ncbi:phosphoadenylyl-sulfate reductase [Gallaecimonas xiamenensis]|uniref:Phosphoadenosine 5'-phosphosulfate reductase n=1 Tax=Gallaecimonas xiamenensis 3-C-1 TaxID=745411 RepID=K2JF60_9GAMM|nr:phosphoadenylyl-sulfate reductase [Gallaecimonas xiamenensis]EKE73723.1 phosphoadenosine phosphosulfate reductase [Gallaecimonas xiamenensis 3-C-1]
MPKSIFTPEDQQLLEGLDAPARVRWALDKLPGDFALSSSFGIQAAVMLHLVSREAPGIPVIFVDTGYHFPETYGFVDQLTAKLGLNLKVYSPKTSAAWQEARHGKRWEQGVDGIKAYNQDNKVEPMQRALDELGVQSWFAGLRRDQSSTRQGRGVLESQNGRTKVYPIIDWNNRDVFRYLSEHGLPYHPLWDKGYVSVGDWHSTVPLSEQMTEEQTRFGGLVRECGLHE